MCRRVASVPLLALLPPPLVLTTLLLCREGIQFRGCGVRVFPFASVTRY